VALLGLALYFFAACFITWLIFFPANRQSTLQILIKITVDSERRIARLKSNASNKSMFLKRKMPHFLREVDFLKHHYLLFLTGLAIIFFPSVLAWLGSQGNRLEEFEISKQEVNLQITEILKGEQLVPPQALPPAVFTTQEIMQARPLLGSASRNWQLLRSDFAQRLLLVFKIMKEKYGYDMAILEGYRSPERQNMLAGMGQHVTNAAAFQSYHQYGLAADCAFLRNGKLIISEQDPWALRGYQLYGEVAGSLGLQWGGHWKMMDLGHTELHLPGVIKK
jgi:peptidoglycan LD-endopeptidase CwlK